VEKIAGLERVTLSDPATRLVRPTTMITCNSLFRTIYYGA